MKEYLSIEHLGVPHKTNTQIKIDKNKRDKNKIKKNKQTPKLKSSNLVTILAKFKNGNSPATEPKTYCVKSISQVYESCTSNIV